MYAVWACARVSNGKINKQDGCVKEGGWRRKEKKVVGCFAGVRTFYEARDQILVIATNRIMGSKKLLSEFVRHPL